MTRRSLRSITLLVAGALGLVAAAAVFEDVVEAVVDALSGVDAIVSDPDGGAADASGSVSDAPRPGEWEVLADLSGDWDFRIGDDPAWAGPEAPADGWTRLSVPAAWEDEGYSGYDGFAWYRTTFALDNDASARARTAPAFLLLGRIDDADEVWLNGGYIGRGGGMPPFYRTASFVFRTYRVPSDLLLNGKNTVAVRVFDKGLEGGILEGPIALAIPTAYGAGDALARHPSDEVPQPVPAAPRPPDAPPPPEGPRPPLKRDPPKTDVRARPPSGTVVADLAGAWRLRRGDDRSWAQPDTDDSAWARVRVPDLWDRQGLAGYDGYAWYRTAVTLTAEQADQDLVLVLGAVDDLDEAFVNGARVGKTGDIQGGAIDGSEWRVQRAYPVPRSRLRAGRNVVAVRVFDAVDKGGIYRGPVALVTAGADVDERRGDDW